MPSHTPALKPLLQFVEEIDNAIHQNPSDEEVAAIIKENFSPDLSVLEDETTLHFAAFKKFNTTFRNDFLSLQILDSKAVTFNADPQNLVGVVGFAQSFLFESKSNGELSTGDTIEIFEVAWDGDGGEEGGKRVITKAFAAFGDMVPIKTSRNAKAKVQKGSVVSKESKRSKASNGVAKKRSAVTKRK